MCITEVKIPKSLIDRFVISVIICLLSLLVAGCGKNLSGKYVSESGVYSIELSSNGTCTWYQYGLQFNGKYYWDSQWDRYCLEISGRGSYADTTYTAIFLDSGDLIVNGGKVNYEYFTKSGANTDDIIKIIICILIIVICAVIIIGFVRKNKTDTTRTDSTDTSDSASSHKNKTHCKSEKEAIKCYHPEVLLSILLLPNTQLKAL